MAASLFFILLHRHFTIPRKSHQLFIKYILGRLSLGRNMGRKRKPTDTQRRVISISLKPTTISLMDEAISESTPRSQWIENVILRHLRATHGVKDDVQHQIITYYECVPCGKEYSRTYFRADMICTSCHQTISFSRQEKVILE